MRVSRHGTRELVAIGLICVAAVVLLARYAVYLVPVPVLLFLFSLYFFRDPSRSVPDEEEVLVSPADGTIADVGEVDENEVLNERCLRIGIFLSIFDVHVNRCPESGRVRRMVYREGTFHNAMTPEAAEENESHLISFEGENVNFAVRQVAGLIARRIVCELDEGTRVERGQRLGMIKFGSRTELYVPLSAGPAAAVEEGETVRGGESVLVRLGDPPS